MFIVGVGGTTSASSSSDRALRLALGHAETLGATTHLFTGDFLKRLPVYDPANTERTDEAVELVRALRAADGVIVSAAAYHGSMSGMLKNALDYTEDMVADERVYLAGVPVGIITVAKGWQAGASTLAAVRSITHALRGWPTPYGCVLNTAVDPSEAPRDPVADGAPALRIVAEEVVHGAERLRLPSRLEAVS